MSRRDGPVGRSALSWQLVSLVCAAAFGAALALTLKLLLDVPAPQSRASAMPEDRVAVVYQQALPGVASVVDLTRLGQSPVQRTAGSAFVIDRDGYLLTNYHVVETIHDPGIVLGNEEVPIPVNVVGEDPSHDLALLKVSLPPERLHPLKLGESSRLRVGERVLAIGSPFGLERSLSTGVVSYLGRPLELEGGVAIEDAIQTDAAINPGNSGGPLLDLGGEVVGISVASVAREIGSFEVGSVGVAFAVPSDRAKALIPRMKGGTLRAHPWLGVMLRDWTWPPAGGSASTPLEGAMVVHTIPGSAAEEAGLRGARYTEVQGESTLEVPGDVDRRD